MPRRPDPSVRVALVERAARMLAAREPVTLRALVEGTGASTMAVYTHFEGMPGLWRAVRQEGFTRLAGRLGSVEATADPVRDLMALGGAYVSSALADPDLYRTMFDAVADLEDRQVADATFGVLVAGADRARREGRFAGSTDPAAVALRLWAFGHGLTMLVLTGVLPSRALDEHVPAMATALFVASGDEPTRCRASVDQGWLAAAVTSAPAVGGPA